MKKSQRKSQAAYIQWIVVGSLVALLLLAGLIAWHSRPSAMVTKKQDALIDGIERRNAARVTRLMSERYGDRWDFRREDTAEALVDVGSQFLTLVLTMEETTLEIEKRRATVTAMLTVGGNPVGPVGNEVTRRVNQLREPFVFTWERETFLPASWRLVEIDNPGLPEDLHGYRPGDIRRAMRGE